MENEKRDFYTNRTLTERVETIEKFIKSLELSGDGLSDHAKIYSGCDQTVVGQQGRGEYDGPDLRWPNGDALGKDRDEAGTSLEAVRDRINACTHRVHERALKLEEIGDRILGPLPSEDVNVGSQWEPNGTLDDVYSSLGRLEAAMLRLEAAMLRLDRI